MVLLPSFPRNIQYLSEDSIRSHHAFLLRPSSIFAEVSFPLVAKEKGIQPRLDFEVEIRFLCPLPRLQTAAPIFGPYAANICRITDGHDDTSHMLMLAEAYFSHSLSIGTEPALNCAIYWQGGEFYPAFSCFLILLTSAACMIWYPTEKKSRHLITTKEVVSVCGRQRCLVGWRRMLAVMTVIDGQVRGAQAPDLTDSVRLQLCEGEVPHMLTSFCLFLRDSFRPFFFPRSISFFVLLNSAAAAQIPGCEIRANFHDSPRSSNLHPLKEFQGTNLYIQTLHYAYLQHLPYV